MLFLTTTGLTPILVPSQAVGFLIELPVYLAKYGVFLVPL